MASPAISRAPSKDAAPQPVAELPKAEKKSTAARKDVPQVAQGLSGSAPDQQEQANDRGAVKVEAGTQAPSVDTLAKAEAAAAHLAPKRGRPVKATSPRAVQSRELMRKRRAGLALKKIQAEELAHGPITAADAAAAKKWADKLATDIIDGAGGRAKIKEGK